MEGLELLVQLVRRSRPRETWYVRSAPATIHLPTPAQAECRLRFASVARAAARAPLEVVAEMVGGEPVLVDGREAVRMPDGRLLLKHQAYVSAVMQGWRSPSAKYEPPLWYRRLALLKSRANLLRALQAAVTG